MIANTWVIEYSEQRLHKTLGNLTFEEFGLKHTENSSLACVKQGIFAKNTNFSYDHTRESTFLKIKPRLIVNVIRMCEGIYYLAESYLFG